MAKSPRSRSLATGILETQARDRKAIYRNSTYQKTRHLRTFTPHPIEHPRNLCALRPCASPLRVKPSAPSGSDSLSSHLTVSRNRNGASGFNDDRTLQVIPAQKKIRAVVAAPQLLLIAWTAQLFTGCIQAQCPKLDIASELRALPPGPNLENGFLVWAEDESTPACAQSLAVPAASVGECAASLRSLSISSCGQWGVFVTASLIEPLEKERQFSLQAQASKSDLRLADNLSWSRLDLETCSFTREAFPTRIQP